MIMAPCTPETLESTEALCASVSTASPLPSPSPETREKVAAAAAFSLRLRRLQLAGHRLDVANTLKPM